MPFGLKNAPAVFQRFIINALGDMRLICTVEYFDNVLVHFTNKEQHKKDLVDAIKALRARSLYLKPGKCEFFKQEVIFLSNDILRDGHAVLPDKTKAISTMPTPKSQKKLQSLLGSITFLKKLPL